ncbi:MAG: calcium-binding protein [Solirubrobacterales bacterium]
MRGPGTSKGLGCGMLAGMAAIAIALPGGATGSPGAPGHTTSLARATGGGAVAAESLTVFTIAGTPAPGRINAFAGPSGRLTLVSPEGIVEPDGPSTQCIQDSATQVSCEPGYVDVIAGDLLGGADVFTAAPSLATGIGIDLVGPDRPLSGGPGRDQINGGSGADLLEGGAGPDVLFGAGLTDVLRGGAGKDELRGGGAPDALLGGGGNDRLDGGGGRDSCNGGGGVDRGFSCTASRKIP